MSNNFTIDTEAKSETLNSNSIIRRYEITLILKITETKRNKSKLTQKQISRQLGSSDSTIKRYIDDFQMDSPFNRNKYRKKNNKSKP